eukprot:5838526-Pyramimonas_sp.AAC.1
MHPETSPESSLFLVVFAPYPPPPPPLSPPPPSPPPPRPNPPPSPPPPPPLPVFPSCLLLHHLMIFILFSLFNQGAI